MQRQEVRSMGFQGKDTMIKVQKPIEKVYFTITNICNNKCSYCFQEKEKRGEDIALSEFGDILEILKSIPIKRLILTGGEASLHPDFGKILNLLDDCPFEMDLFTNGILSETAIAQINQSSVKRVYISLDGSDSHSNHSRGRATISVVEQSIEALNKEIVIMNTLHAQNYQNVSSFLSYCSHFGNVTKVNFNPIKILHESYSDLALTKNMLDEVNRKIAVFTVSSSLKVRSYYNCYSDVVMNCNAGENSIAIDINGDVSGCIFGSSVDRDVFVIGNLWEENLKDMWEDRKRWTMFDKTSDESCSRCSNVNQCTHICSMEHYFVKKSENEGAYLCAMRGTV